MSTALLFYRLMVRPLARDFVRTALMVFAIALGVGVVLAIELAGDAAAGSFRSSIATLSGDDNLEVVAVAGVPEDVVGTLARLPYPLRVEPRLEDHATVAASGETVPLIGLDLLSAAERTQFAGLNATPELLNLDDTVFVASRLGRKPGETIRLVINDRARDYIVRGILPETNDGESLVIMDLGAAQRALNRFGRIDRVLLKVPDSPALAEWQRRLRSVLPEGVEIRPQGSGTAENRRMLAAFRWNLRVLSYVALVVACFLIYNTVSVSVVRRRPEIGILRAIGATSRAVRAAFVGEALCLGVAGSLLGLPLGRAMAAAAVRLLSATVQSLYVSSQPRTVAANPGSGCFGTACRHRRSGTLRAGACRRSSHGLPGRGYGARTTRVHGPRAQAPRSLDRSRAGRERSCRLSRARRCRQAVGGVSRLPSADRSLRLRHSRAGRPFGVGFLALALPDGRH